MLDPGPAGPRRIRQLNPFGRRFMENQALRTLQGKEAVVAISSCLPELLSGVSIERAQIIADQWTTAIQSGQADAMISVALLQSQAGENQSDSTGPPVDGHPTSKAAKLVGAAVAVHESATNSATLLFSATQGQACSEAVGLLSESLEQQMLDRGVAFVQWATDAITMDPAADDVASHPSEEPLKPRDLPAAMGFGLLGTLQYMAISPSQDSSSLAWLNQADQREWFDFQAIDWDQEREPFTTLVEETYEGSLDCPGFTDYRTAEDLLESYRASPHACSDGWMWVREDGVPKGVLIMGLHGVPTSRTTDQKGERQSAEIRSAESDEIPPPVAELTYMGLVPSQRGGGGGAYLLRHAWQWARGKGCERMILAVDVQNAPARSIYEAHGFSPILRETVWGRNIQIRPSFAQELPTRSREDT